MTKSKVIAKSEPNGTISVRFRHTKETKGAHQFQECDEKGNPIEDFKDCKIGSIYLRKNHLPNGEVPEFIKVSVAL